MIQDLDHELDLTTGKLQGLKKELAELLDTSGTHQSKDRHKSGLHLHASVRNDGDIDSSSDNVLILCYY